MKTFLSLFGLLAISLAVFSGCASSDESASAYPDPNPLDTQARIQKMHSEAFQQRF